MFSLMWLHFSADSERSFGSSKRSFATTERALELFNDTDTRGTVCSQVLLSNKVKRRSSRPLLRCCGYSHDQNSLESLTARRAAAERRASAQEALLALTELLPSEHLKSVRSPRSAISKAFDEGKTAMSEGLGSLDPRQEIEECKTEAVGALRSLNLLPALREAVDEGRTRTSAPHFDALTAAAPSVGQVKHSIDARPTLREVVEGGKESAVETLEGIAATVPGPRSV